MLPGLLSALLRAQVPLLAFLVEGVGGGSSAPELESTGVWAPTCGETAPVTRSIPWNRLKLRTFLIPRSQFLQTSTDSGRCGNGGFVNVGHSFQHIWQSGIYSLDG